MLRGFKMVRGLLQPFELLEGNTQGYSWARNVAVSCRAAGDPSARGSTSIARAHSPGEAWQLRNAPRPDGVRGRIHAHLVLSDVGAEEPHWNKADSRGYIQGWLGSRQRLTDEQIKGVFKVTDRVLRAGRPASDGSS